MTVQDRIQEQAQHLERAWATDPRWSGVTRGYTAEETQKILAKLAQHDHETISDAIYDSLGAGDKTLDQMIADMLRD